MFAMSWNNDIGFLSDLVGVLAQVSWVVAVILFLLFCMYFPRRLEQELLKNFKMLYERSFDALAESNAGLSGAAGPAEAQPDNNPPDRSEQPKKD